MDLGDTYPVPVGERILIVLSRSHEADLAARLLHHTIIDDIELVVEEDFAVDLTDDVVLHQHETVDLDVNREAIRIEARANLLVDLNENVVRRLLDGPFAIFLGHRVDQFKFLKRNLLHQIIQRARVQLLGVRVDQVLEPLTVRKLREAKVNYLIHQLVDEHKVGAQ